MRKQLTIGLLRQSRAKGEQAPIAGGQRKV